MSDKRNREIRELKAETGLCYTRAAREVARRRRTGRPLRDAFQGQMAQLQAPAMKSILGQMAQLNTPFHKAVKGWRLW